MDRIFDAIYFSAATYSTVGFGDLSPIGALRMLAGLEAVTGLLVDHMVGIVHLFRDVAVVVTSWLTTMQHMK